MILKTTPAEVTVPPMIQVIPLPPGVITSLTWSLFEGIKLNVLVFPTWAIPFFNHVNVGVDPVPEVVEVTKTLIPEHIVVVVEEIATAVEMVPVTEIVTPVEVEIELVTHKVPVPPMVWMVLMISLFDGE